MSNRKKSWLNKKNISTGILCCFAIGAVYAGLYYDEPEKNAELPQSTAISEVAENDFVVQDKITISDLQKESNEAKIVSNSKEEPLVEITKNEEVEPEAEIVEEVAKNIGIAEEVMVVEEVALIPEIPEMEEATPVMSGDSSGLIWPVTGEIVMSYGVDIPVFDVTLEQYRINNYVSIATDMGEYVKASGDGTVSFVGVDKERGNMVVIDHNDGWTTTYCQLQDGIMVEEGQKVKQGENIGAVGEPSIYSVALGSHLDFKISNDTETVDPEIALSK